MDFKVTGTEKGITAFQMDTKIKGVAREIMAAALEQARRAGSTSSARWARHRRAPRRAVAVRARASPPCTSSPTRSARSSARAARSSAASRTPAASRSSVDDSGKVEIASSDQAATDKAMQMIREITQEAEIGALYLGVVKRIVDFGAFVEIFPGTDGLIHISHLANERVDRVSDVVAEGDEVLVRVIDIDRAARSGSPARKRWTA
jgi:polyribonucleotide nucleotidyltransferase